jgi:hypothetical protein
MAGGLAGRQLSGGYGMLVLPKKPVKPGESWTDVQIDTRPPAGKKGQPVKLTRTTKYTLKEIVQQEGHSIAIIDSVTEFSMPADALKSIVPFMKVDNHHETITATTQFDVDAGEIVLAHYKISSEMAMSMAAPPDAAGVPPGAMPPGGMKMSISGNGTAQVSRK